MKSIKDYVKSLKLKINNLLICKIDYKSLILQIKKIDTVNIAKLWAIITALPSKIRRTEIVY